jgi:hypothetical protein
VVQQYKRGAALTPEQARCLRFRGDCYAPRDGKLVAVFADDRERRAAWVEHGGQLAATNPGTRPEPFWTFTAGVPDELRALPAAPGDPWEAAAAHGRHARARRDWLLTHPEHLRDDERDALRAS